MTTARLALPALRLPPMPHIRHWLAMLVLVTGGALYLIAGLSLTTLRPGATPALANVARDIAELERLRLWRRAETRDERHAARDIGQGRRGARLKGRQA